MLIWGDSLLPLHYHTALTTIKPPTWKENCMQEKNFLTNRTSLKFAVTKIRQWDSSQQTVGDGEVVGGSQGGRNGGGGAGVGLTGWRRNKPTICTLLQGEKLRLTKRLTQESSQQVTQSVSSKVRQTEGQSVSQSVGQAAEPGSPGSSLVDSAESSELTASEIQNFQQQSSFRSNSPAAELDVRWQCQISCSNKGKLELSHSLSLVIDETVLLLTFKFYFLILQTLCLGSKCKWAL